jgi:hypothetical protein
MPKLPTNGAFAKYGDRATSTFNSNHCEEAIEKTFRRYRGEPQGGTEAPKTPESV